MFFMKKKKPSKTTARTRTKATAKVKSKSKSAKPDLVSVKVKTHNDANGGHPHVIVDNIDDKHVSVGLSTQKKKGKNHTNYPLERSPLNDGKHSYMRRQGTVAPKWEYEKPRKGKMTPKDYAQAKTYGARAKNKYITEKNAKKSNDKSDKHCAKHSKSISRGK